ncbi:hypothetical protein MFIFM68171_08737 [Madurella fahalii]|uniref:Uncharacterized protein n=1 Tax=Madurella fahalii TaxID=1157608 RepID=A0ABQ0GLA2_9PEZI
MQRPVTSVLAIFFVLLSHCSAEGSNPIYGHLETIQHNLTALHQIRAPPWYLEVRDLAKYLREKEAEQSRRPASAKYAWGILRRMMGLKPRHERDPVPLGDLERAEQGEAEHADYEFDLKYGFFVAMGGLEISCSDPEGDDKPRVRRILSPKGCIARKVYGLPLTLLELHTMVHVACAIIMYGFWLEKPLDLRSPEMLDDSQYPTICMEYLNSDRETYFYARRGNFRNITLSRNVPEKIRRYLGNDTLPLLLMNALPILYGGIHLSAWNFEFPSTVEEVMWKTASVAIASAIPLLLALIFVVASCSTMMGQLPEPWGGRAEDLIDDTLVFMWLVPLPLVYMVSRIFIVIEAFISLRRVPIGVYWTPAWIQMIPHI